MSFTADLAYGRTGEAKVLDWLTNQHPGCTWQQSEGKQAAFDLYCEHCGDMVEVKSDRKAAETGNLCLERNLFLHSKAQDIVYLVAGKALMFNRQQLWRQVRKLNALGLTDYRLLGDGWRNPAILVKLEYLEPIATVVEL